VCPQGFFCPKGTTTPQACANGYFSTSYGAVDNSLCIECTAGFYCTSFKARDFCPAGKKCPVKTFDLTAASVVVATGHFTEIGFPEQVKCLYGFYQDL